MTSLLIPLRHQLDTIPSQELQDICTKLQYLRHPFPGLERELARRDLSSDFFYEQRKNSGLVE